MERWMNIKQQMYCIIYKADDLRLDKYLPDNGLQMDQRLLYELAQLI